MTYKFIPGLELNRAFYKEVVGPLLKKEFPELKYAAALTGNGSDVLGFDDYTSMDHNWGPKMRLVLPEKNFAATKRAVDTMFRHRLPYTFMGFPTNYTKESDGYLKQGMQLINRGPVNHLIRFYTIKSFFKHYLGIDPYKKMDTRDWLTFPDQALLEITAGEVFHDTIGFKKMQKRFEYYPQDVWYYVMWIQWGRMTNELAFQARSARTGDELGSRLIAARMVRRIVKMTFLLERKYAPYTKWVGTAFQKLDTAKRLEPLLLKVVKSDQWKVRQKYLTEAHKVLGEIHNERKITKSLPVNIIDFHGRGYKIFDMEPYIKALKVKIKNPLLKHMKYELGSIDQFIDHSRINHENYVYRKLKSIIR
jgi:hypothetical protein